MGFLRIHCHNCGNHWDINEGDDYKQRKYKTCPYCKEQIDGQDFDNQVLPAFGAMMDANRELKKTHTGYNASLFSVEFMQDCCDDDDDEYTDTEKLADSMDLLRESVDGLTNALLTVDFVRKYS